jgi:hypothetical protein
MAPVTGADCAAITAVLNTAVASANTAAATSSKELRIPMIVPPPKMNLRRYRRNNHAGLKLTSSTLKRPKYRGRTIIPVPEVTIGIVHRDAAGH